MSFTDMLIMVVVILLISLVLLLIIHSSCPAWQTMISGTSRRIRAGRSRLLSAPVSGYTSMIIGRITGLRFMRFHKKSLKLSLMMFFILPQSFT